MNAVDCNEHAAIEFILLLQIALGVQVAANKGSNGSKKAFLCYASMGSSDDELERADVRSNVSGIPRVIIVADTT